jgi:hypothetical protein
MEGEEQNAKTLKLVTTTTTTSGRRGAQEEVRKLIETGVGLDLLRQNFARFLENVQAVIDAGQDQAGDFVLDEITFSAEIGADGEFKLLGTGFGVTASSGITFTLRRKLSEKTDE